ncbi:gamma-butyrobetaine hydroxylase-like domain-containing protein [Teredinibacter purpureus]|uniref:gamma-butyrobetaine hydroxylase-like domain-containing protein n=1 Tax=Teredinibacter purpureus TaxID=2731756 RepID=UPI0005F829BF|nr:DUF971 domain-containing protein [Teredinibacter purpureus]
MNLTPSAIKLHRKSCILEISFGDTHYPLAAEYLRVYSPSAEVKGHGPGEEVLQLNKQTVAITGIEPLGNYAIKLIFSDGHDSGIYSWEYLQELGANNADKWQNYLDRVATHEAQEDAAKTSTVKWVGPL